jgi:hypothetical protein
VSGSLKINQKAMSLLWGIIKIENPSVSPFGKWRDKNEKFF